MEKIIEVLEQNGLSEYLAFWLKFRIVGEIAGAILGVIAGVWIYKNFFKD